LRVAVVVKSLQIGGMERAAINLAETFANEGHESHLIYFKPKKQELTANDKVTLHLFNLEKSLKLTGIGILLRLFAKLLNAIVRYSYFYLQGLMLSPIFKYSLYKLEKEYGDFDLVIVRGQGTFEMIWSYNHKKLIIQQVNVLREYKSPLNNFFQRTIFAKKQVVCNAPTILKELTNDFANYGVRVQNLHMIPSPINPEIIKLKSEIFSPDITNKYIVNVGRLVPVKNLYLLLESYAYARENLSLKHFLVIVGSGNLKLNLEQQAKDLNIDKYIIFTGPLENPYPWLKHADLFAFTSKNEGLPNVLLESLACRTNIVSTRGRGGTLDIMSGDLAENLTAFDTKEFAQKMVDVLNTKKDINFEGHLQKYSPKSVADEYLKYIQKV